MFSLICARISNLVNNLEADDLSRHRAHYYVIVMTKSYILSIHGQTHDRGPALIHRFEHIEADMEPQIRICTQKRYDRFDI